MFFETLLLTYSLLVQFHVPVPQFHIEVLPIIKSLYKETSVPPSNVNKKLVQFIKDECEKQNVPYLLVFKLIQQESDWDSQLSCSNKGWVYGKWVVISTDYGLMQLNSKCFSNFIEWFKDKDRTVKSYDLINNSYDNVQIGIRYLKDLYHSTGNWKLAVAAYNAGLYAVNHNQIPKSSIAYLNRICPYPVIWEILSTIKDS